MDLIYLLKNTVQNYTWGSKKAIPELLGETYSLEKPVAELWMGTHPRGASQAIVNNQVIPLPDLISQNPGQILGPVTTEKFSGQLPFLFKILAADKPLSIQAHPDQKQARAGYARENRAGIELDAFNRTYKDENHKPEIICGITDFWALNGFQPYREIVDFFVSVNSGYIKEEIAQFARYLNSQALKAFYTSVLTMDSDKKRGLVADILEYAAANKNIDQKCEWLLKIHNEFPGDPGIISVAMLNLVQLRPGEAMFLPARQLHAYLFGLGIELMANSDNVLRGGLTEKYINVPELMEILDFTEKEITILRPEKIANGFMIYKTPAAEFQLGKITITNHSVYENLQNQTVSILICLRGEATIKDLISNKTVKFHKGQSLLIAAALTRYAISGEADIYCARVP